MQELLILLAAWAADGLERFRRWLTFRRVVGIVIFMILLLSLRQFVEIGVDVSFLFGLDLGLVVEVSALLILLSVRDQVMGTAYTIRRFLLRRPRLRHMRRTMRRAIRSRAGKPLLPPPPDEEPAFSFA